MIVDTSAIIAILRNEPEADSCARAIESSAVRRISAANFVETAVVIDASRDPIASRRFDDFIKEAQITIEPVTEAQARIARDAYRDFRPWQRPSRQAEFRRLFCLCAGEDDERNSPVQRDRFYAHRYQSGQRVGACHLAPAEVGDRRDRAHITRPTLCCAI